MRPALLTLLLVIGTNGMAAEPTPSRNPALTAMAQRFVNAIGRGDVTAGMACWLSFEQWKAFVTNPPPGVNVPKLSAMEMGSFEKERARLNTVVTARLTTLFEELKKRVDLTHIQLAEVTPRDMKMEDGLPCAQQVTITMTAGDAKIEYRMGGGGQFGDRWYCVESPGSGATLIRNNKSESIPCGKPGKPTDATPATAPRAAPLP